MIVGKNGPSDIPALFYNMIPITCISAEDGSTS